MEQQKNTHGGKREGSGKPPQDLDQGARVKVSITLSKKHYEMTAGNRSGIIEEALIGFFMLDEFHGLKGPETIVTVVK
jgi:hypothetical protein